MEIKKTVSMPAWTREVVEKTICDLCKQPIGRPRGYEVDEIRINRKTGNSYPEAGWGENARIDMCGSCWETKFIPWLQTMAASPDVTDWEF